MNVIFKPCKLNGTTDAVPSKSMAHRYLISAALSGETCYIYGVDYSEDILASIDCLRALGADITADGDTVCVKPSSFMKVENPTLDCRESGSTLRFFIPLAMCLGKKVVLKGSKRLFERPLDIYEDICKENGFIFEKSENSLTLCADFKAGYYKVRGDISSQFITGLIFAMVYRNEESTIRITPPFESKSYVNLTIDALKKYGADVSLEDDYTIILFMLLFGKN